MHPKSNFIIEANHLGYGTVMFVIPASDARDAFRMWKQIVASPRQWIVKRNETDGVDLPAHAAQPDEGRDLAEVDKV
jgi:hypothetical protein